MRKLHNIAISSLILLKFLACNPIQAHATILEEIPVDSYIEFDSHIWRKTSYFAGENGLEECSSVKNDGLESNCAGQTAQTYLHMTRWANTRALEQYIARCVLGQNTLIEAIEIAIIECEAAEIPISSDENSLNLEALISCQTQLHGGVAAQDFSNAILLSVFGAGGESRPFDKKYNTCTNDNSGYNDFSTSSVKTWLNSDFYNTLQHSNWVSQRSDWSIVEQSDCGEGSLLVCNNAGSLALVGKRAKNAGDSCESVDSGTAPAVTTAKVGLLSFAETWKTSSGSFAGETTRTPYIRTVSGNYVRKSTFISYQMFATSESNDIFPALHLKSGLMVVSGDGTQENPYVLSDGNDDSLVTLPDLENINEIKIAGKIFLLSDLFSVTTCENEPPSESPHQKLAIDDILGIEDFGDAWDEWNTVVGKVGVSQKISVTLEETLTISAAFSLETTLIPAPQGLQKNMETEVYVSANSPNGYYLTLENTSAESAAMLSDNNAINSIGDAEKPLTNGTWGFQIGDNPLSQVAEMTGFKGVPLKGAAVTIANVPHEVANNATPVTFGVKADTRQPVGNYKTTVLYTAVTAR
jgi:hypothetical protein